MDVLNDIENDLDGDWKDIYDKVEREHELAEIQDPVIPNFPTYEEFYECLVHTLNYDRMSSLPVDFLHMAHKITQSRDMGKPPESFNKVWSFFCDPHRYRKVKRECRCGLNYTVILKISHLQSHTLRSRSRSFGEDRIMEWEEVEIKQKYAYCVESGNPFLSIANEELVGLFKE